MSELEKVAITLPMDDWDFVTAVLAAQAADYRLLSFAKTDKEPYIMLARRCMDVCAAIQQALHHQPGRYERGASNGGQ